MKKSFVYLFLLSQTYATGGSLDSVTPSSEDMREISTLFKRKRVDEGGVSQPLKRACISHPQRKEVSDSMWDQPLENLKNVPENILNENKLVPSVMVNNYIRGLSLASENLQSAFKWIKSAADLGYDLAQYEIGVCYDEGVGTHIDRDKAVFYYKKAADQRNGKAFHNLGVTCFEKEDYNLALKYFYSAAREGVPESIYNVGACLEHGLGTNINQEKALKYYNIAAQWGFTRGKEAIDELTQNIYYKNSPARKIDIDQLVHSYNSSL